MRSSKSRYGRQYEEKERHKGGVGVDPKRYKNPYPQKRVVRKSRNILVKPGNGGLQAGH
jgi:hypothetical protein